MRNKTIGLDFDWTLVKCKESIWDVTCKALNMKKGSIKPLQKYGISSYPRRIRHTMFNFFTDPFYMTDLEKMPFCDLLIKKLADPLRNNKLCIITARHESIHSVTLTWIRTFLPMIPYVLFVNPIESKEKLFEEANIDVWIDDNEIDVKKAVDMDIETYHLTNTTWGEFNHVEGAKRVKSLYKILEDLDE